MQRPHIITLSGKPGSGKSSTADKVAELLGYTRYSSGELVRRVLKKHGISLADFNARAKQDHSLDQEIDEELRRLRKEKDIVIDARLGFYWIPESFKVYLELDTDVAIARIYKDAVENLNRGSEVSLSGSIHDIQTQVLQRMHDEQTRFRNLYGIDPYDTSNFDLVINTARHSPQTVALTIFDNYKKWLTSDTWHRVTNQVPAGYSMT
jgi:cytidylate kinase